MKIYGITKNEHKRFIGVFFEDNREHNNNALWVDPKPFEIIQVETEGEYNTFNEALNELLDNLKVYPRWAEREITITYDLIY